MYQIWRLVKRGSDAWSVIPRPEDTLPFADAADPLAVQQFIAKESGLSLVSDYFAAWGPQPIPAEARAPQLLWQLLYVEREPIG